MGAAVSLGGRDCVGRDHDRKTVSVSRTHHAAARFINVTVWWFDEMIYSDRRYRTIQ
jgi:hypothetical protein